eukprot:scaffold3334_cov369-Prasinococcus_capsulatus_cf.AAC.12
MSSRARTCPGSSMGGRRSALCSSPGPALLRQLGRRGQEPPKHEMPLRGAWQRGTSPARRRGGKGWYTPAPLASRHTRADTLLARDRARVRPRILGQGVMEGPARAGTDTHPRPTARAERAATHPDARIIASTHAATLLRRRASARVAGGGRRRAALSAPLSLSLSLSLSLGGPPTRASGDGGSSAGVRKRERGEARRGRRAE